MTQPQFVRGHRARASDDLGNYRSSPLSRPAAALVDSSTTSDAAAVVDGGGMSNNVNAGTSSSMNSNNLGSSSVSTTTAPRSHLQYGSPYSAAVSANPRPTSEIFTTATTTPSKPTNTQYAAANASASTPEGRHYYSLYSKSQMVVRQGITVSLIQTTTYEN